MTQLKLTGIPAPESHGNRGRLFQDMLERTHDYYERQGIGYVYPIPNAFAFCSEREYNSLPASMKARTGDGRPLKRVKTPGDYMGVVRGAPVAFDAKEFAGTNIPLANFKPHQVRNLTRYSQGGGLAGFFVYAKKINSVFWIYAERFSPIYVSGQLKSLNFAWLQSNAVLISGQVNLIKLDWAAVLLPQKGVLA